MEARFMVYMPFCFDPRYWRAAAPDEGPGPRVYFSEARSCTTNSATRLHVAPVFKYHEGNELKVRQEHEYGLPMLVLRCCTEWLDPNAVKDADNATLLQRRMFNVEHMELCAAKCPGLFAAETTLGVMAAACFAKTSTRASAQQFAAALLEAFAGMARGNPHA
jgi:hypothetical protein